MQRIYQIAQFKQRLEAAKQFNGGIRNDDISKAWNEKVKVSSGEAVSSTFVEAAMFLHKNVLSDPTLREHILGVRQ